MSYIRIWFPLVGLEDIADWTAIRAARCISPLYTKKQKNEEGTIVPPGWNNNLIVDAILFLPTGAVVDIWSHWLPSCLVPSSVSDGRHDLNLMVALLYSCTPRRSLRVALAIKILFLPPWLLALPPRPRARFFLDLFVPDPSFLSSRLLVISRCSTRYALAIKSARLPRTFTRSLTPGSAEVKGTDVLA